MISTFNNLSKTQWIKLLVICLMTLIPSAAFGMQTVDHYELRRAVIDGKTEKVKSLLSHATDIPDPQKGQLSYLVEAANAGNVEITKLLLKYGADPSHEFWNGWTALTFAAQHGHLDVVKLLILANPSPTRKQLNQALLVSAGTGHPQTSKTLIKAGASVSAAGPGGLNPIHLSAKGGYPLTTKTLLESGAEISAQDSAGLTPLMWAAWTAQKAVVQTLLDMGADSAIKDPSGNTAFYGLQKNEHWTDLMKRHWSSIPLECGRCDVIAGNASVFKPRNQNVWDINTLELYSKPEQGTPAFVILPGISHRIKTTIKTVELNEFSYEETGKKEWNAELEPYTGDELDAISGQKRGLFIWSKAPVNPTLVQPKRKHLPWGMFPSVVQEAVDLNGDGLPDVLHVAYCCSDKTAGNLEQCEYYCTEYWIRKNEKWLKCKSSSPA